MSEHVVDAPDDEATRPRPSVASSASDPKFMNAPGGNPGDLGGQL
jgi:hypothetical protein